MLKNTTISAWFNGLMKVWIRWAKTNVINRSLKEKKRMIVIGCHSLQIYKSLSIQFLSIHHSFDLMFTCCNSSLFYIRFYLLIDELNWAKHARIENAFRRLSWTKQISKPMDRGDTSSQDYFRDQADWAWGWSAYFCLLLFAARSRNR